MFLRLFVPFAAILPFYLLLPHTLSAAPARSVELILDASGSMNSRLPSGMTRIGAAREALRTATAALDPEARLAFRAYGHREPGGVSGCDNTELLVAFGPAAGTGPRAADAADDLEPRGGTPLSRVLAVAADDFPAAPDSDHTIVLVSDGKETCEGDPCLTAKLLEKKGASFRVNTVGFAADDAARRQLACVAAVTGGAYFPAADAKSLAKAIAGALTAPPAAPGETLREGTIEVRGAGPGGHPVINAATGGTVGTINAVRSTISLPEGIYQVTFGPGAWKGVAVAPGTAVVLEPGVLGVRAPAVGGHRVIDSETGVEYGILSPTKSRLSLLPGVYDVSFGAALWRYVTVDAGEETILEPGRVRVDAARDGGYPVFDEAGRPAGTVADPGAGLFLPPGTYTIDMGTRRETFSLAAGEEKAFLP